MSIETRILTGFDLAERVHARNLSHVARLGRRPCCVTLYDAQNAGARAYLARQLAEAQQSGVEIRPEPWDLADPQAQLARLAESPDCDAIIPLFPLPKGLSPEEAALLIGAARDVDGQHPLHAGEVLLGRSTARAPATAMASLLCAIEVMGDLGGAHIALVGASSLIGRPLVPLLTARGATVTLCHIETRDLPRHTSGADLVITAAGVPNLLGRAHIRQGGMVLDLAITRHEGRLVGDCDLKALSGHAGLVSHVPDGVGPVTTACLMANVVAAARGTAPDYPI